jgi:hypothetical protein
VLAPEKGTEFVQQCLCGFALERTNYFAEFHCRQVPKQEVYVVVLCTKLNDFTINGFSNRA